MSYVLDWIQEAARLLKEALDDEQSDNGPHFAHSKKWREDAAALLKPKPPRSGQ